MAAPIQPIDLQNAKQDTDHIAAIATSTALTATDRLGRSKLTIDGVIDRTKQMATVALGNLGYLPPVAYAAGIVLSATNQTVSREGVVYAPRIDALPFTTSGVFENDKFRVVQSEFAGVSTDGELFAIPQWADVPRVKTVLSDPDETLNAQAQALLNRTEILHGSYVRIEEVGGKDDDDTDLGAAIAAAIAKLGDAGGAIELTGNGVYRWRTPVSFQMRRPIHVFSKARPTILFDHPENTVAFWCRRNPDGGDLLNNCGFDGINFRGMDRSISRTALRFSDGYGHYIRNSLVFNHDKFLQLFNEIGWTEGFEMTNVMLRTSRRYMTFDRLVNGQATNSFGHMNLNAVTAAMETPGSVFAELTATDPAKDMDVYNMRARGMLFFFDGTGGGKAAFFANGQYARFSGYLEGTQDFTGGIYDGSDLVPFFSNNGGHINFQGSYDNLEKSDISSGDGLKFRQVVKVEPSSATDGPSTLARFKGAVVNLVGQTVDGQIYKYDSGLLPPGGNFKVTISGGGQGYIGQSVWLVSLGSYNDIPYTKCLVGIESEGVMVVRGKDGLPGGTQVVNVGPRFEIYRPAGSSVAFRAEIEML